MISEAKPIPYCHFCGKAQHEVVRLIAGPTSYICDECVTLCARIVAEGDAFDRMKREGMVAVPKADAERIMWMKTWTTGKDR